MLNSIQKKLWNELFFKDSEGLYYFWFEKFDNFQRIQVWNSFSFSLESFITLKKKHHCKEKYNKKIDEIVNGKWEFNYKILMRLLHNKKWLKASDIILRGNSSSLAKRLSSLEACKTTKQKFNKLYKYWASIKDYRTALWLPLSLNQKLKMLLFQRDPFEFNIMCTLIMKELESQKRIAAKMDNLLEKTLNSVIYQKYFLMWELRSQGFSLYKYDKYIGHFTSEIGPIIKFIQFLERKNNDIQRAIYKERKDIRSQMNNLK